MSWAQVYSSVLNNNASSSIASGSSTCEHKASTKCLLTLKKCCACADSRPHMPRYKQYQDGRKNVLSAERWGYYCGSCKSFWDHQVRIAKIPPSSSRIPEYPKPILDPEPPSSSQGFNSAFSYRSTPLVESSSRQPMSVPVRTKKNKKKNKKTGQGLLDIFEESLAISLGTQSENTPETNPPISPPAYVCPAIRNLTSQANPREIGAPPPSDLPAETPARWIPPNARRPGNSSSGPQAPSLSPSAKKYVPPSARAGASSGSWGWRAPQIPQVPPLHQTSNRWVPPNARARSGSNSGDSQPPPPTPDSAPRPVSWQTLLGTTQANGTSTGNQGAQNPPRAQGVNNPYNNVTPANGWGSPGESANRVVPSIGSSVAGVSLDEPQRPVIASRASQQAANTVPSSAQRPALSLNINPQVNYSVPNHVNGFPSSNTGNNHQSPAAASLSTAGSYQPIAPGAPSWFDWASSMFEDPTAAHAAPRVGWSPPRVQPLSNDPDVQRQTEPFNPGSRANQYRPPQAQPNNRNSVGPAWGNYYGSNNTVQYLPRMTRPHQGGPPQANPNSQGSMNGGYIDVAGISVIPPQSPQNPPRLPERPVPGAPRGWVQDHSEPDSDDSEWEVRPTQDYPPPPRPVQTAQPPPPAQVAQPPPPQPPIDLGDEWETWDDAALAAAATPAVRDPPPTELDLAQAAEDASILLELFSKTKPRNDEEIGDEFKQMIENAFQSILKIRREFRVIAARKNEDIVLVADEEGTVDSECIICYNNIADTVLMPCKHLVLCIACCDKMGIKEKDTPGPRTVQCPICRTKILDRMKIFRG